MKKDRMEAEVRKYIEKWRPRLNLQEWSFEICFPEKSAVDESLVADILPNPDYMTGKINVYDLWGTCDRLEREHAILHELCHCHVEELNQLVRRAWKDQLVTAHHLESATERLTQRMANALLPFNKKVLRG